MDLFSIFFGFPFLFAIFQLRSVRVAADDRDGLVVDVVVVAFVQDSARLGNELGFDSHFEVVSE